MFFLRKKTNAKDLEAFQEALPEGVIARVSERASRLSLKLDVKRGGFELVLPKRTNLLQARDFVERHKGWMSERLQTLAQPVYFADGAQLSVWGQEVTVCLDRARPYRAMPVIEGDRLVCGGDAQVLPARIERFLKAQAKKRLDIMAREKAATIGHSISRVITRDPQTRWGSCNTERVLSFSWRLILAPFEVADYVVAHEVAHLEHMDHSRDFWRLCASLCESDMRSSKNWLKEHGRSLHLYKAR